MSTYVYLACLDHTPPLINRDESEQHASEADIAKIRSWIERRDVLVPLQREYLLDTSDQFFRHTVHFLADHETCRIAAKTEYGEWIDLGMGLHEEDS